MRLLALLFAPLAAIAAAKPNVILILADDFGYECVTANGGQSYKTPHLDRLAAAGIRFEQCHVQPICTATRVQLMTGRYNIRNYLDFGTLIRTETTFGQLFKKAGYATGICGKWQLGREADAPQHFGFDEALLWQHTRLTPRYANPGLELNGVAKEYPPGSYGPKLINDFALDFITRHKEAPFFLYYPMILAHAPYQPTPDSPGWDPSAKGEGKQQTRNFADMVSYLDKMVGRLDAKLDELGIRENTLLLFIGDNGTGRDVTSRFDGADYRGGKGTTTARGYHVPFIASWPGAIKQGRVSRDLISSTDFLPTICAAAGIPVSAGVDGVSFLPQLRGEKGAPREWLYSWYSPRQSNDMSISEFAFTQDAKLYRTGTYFDLRADPDEKKPLKVAALTGSAADTAKQLQAVLAKFQDARPAELDKAFQQAIKGDAKAKQKNKGAGK